MPKKSAQQSVGHCPNPERFLKERYFQPHLHAAFLKAANRLSFLATSQECSAYPISSFPSIKRLLSIPGSFGQCQSEMQWHRGVEGAVADFDWQDWRAPLRPSHESLGSSVNVTAPALHGLDTLRSEDEYSIVVRVYSDISVPEGYKHVDAGEALFVVEYAREMTLARGRILYEVWNRWMNCSFGYLVASHIHSEAISYRTTFDAWNSLRFHDRTIRQHAHRLVTDQFPRMNPTSAKIIAETMIIEKRQVTPRNIEQNVINHLRHYWSSYELRLSRKDGEGKCSPRKDILEAIKPRMRAMMQKWLPQDTDETRLAMLWRKHHLLDEMNSQGACKEEAVFHRPTALTWYGGQETVGNLVNTERAVRYFA